MVTEEKHLAVLTVEVEHTEGYNGSVDGLAQQMVVTIFKILGIKPLVRVLGPNTLERATHKAKRVFDERKK